MLTCEIRLVQTAIYCVTCDRWATRGYTAADQPEWGKSITVRADECTYLGQSSSYTVHKRCIRYKVSVWVTKNTPTSLQRSWTEKMMSEWKCFNHHRFSMLDLCVLEALLSYSLWPMCFFYLNFNMIWIKFCLNYQRICRNVWKFSETSKTENTDTLWKRCNLFYYQ